MAVPQLVKVDRVGVVPIQTSVRTATDADKLVALGAGGILANSFLPEFSSSTRGAVPFSGGGTTNFLRADGNWVVPPVAGVPALITVADESTDTSCFLSFFTAATGDLNPKTNTNLQFNSSTGALTFGSVLDAATGDEAALTMNFQFNKLTSGDAVGLLLNMTDTLSPGQDNFVDFKKGGLSRLRVTGNGQVFLIDTGFYAIGPATILNKVGTTLHIGDTTNLTSIEFFHGHHLSSGDVFKFLEKASAQLTSSSSAQSWMSLTPDVNQSGAAGFIGFFLDAALTNLGSGVNRLLDLRADTTSLFAVGITGTARQDKGTLDEPFKNYVASADLDATSAISTLTTVGAVDGQIQIEVNGVTAWQSFTFTDPT